MIDEELERKKELLKYNRERFNLFFSLILHIDRKSASFLSLILVTESILLGFAPFLIEKINSLYLMLLIVILLVLTSAILGYASFILLRGLRPTQALLPEIPLESSNIKELYWKEYESLNDFISQNDSLLVSKAQSLYRSIKFIKISIFLICVILFTFFVFYVYYF